MPRYIIHVGPMKTGSTYLQKCLKAAADELEMLGIYYPREVLFKRQHLHMALYNKLRKGQEEDLKSEFIRLNESNYQTILLSCEFLSKLDHGQLSRLKAVIGVDDIEIVYVVRRWCDRIPSMWSQSLYPGGSETLPSFYIDLLNTIKDHPDIDYSILWNDIAMVFGRQNLSLFPYSTIVDHREDVFVRFCTDILRIDKVPKPKWFGTKVLGSQSVEDSEILRVLNELYFRAHGESSTQMYWQLKRFRRDKDLPATKAALALHHRTLQLDENAIHFAPIFARLESFADRLTLGDTVFQRRARKEIYFSPNYLLEHGVYAEIQTLFAKLNAAAKIRTE
jgi:hypothetical protein